MENWRRYEMRRQDWQRLLSTILASELSSRDRQIAETDAMVRIRRYWDYMDVIQTLIEKLSKRAEFVWARGEHWLKIDAPPSGGFAVELRREGDEWTVYLGDGVWHQHFGDPEEALEFVAWCYSGEARVREVWRGRSLSKAALDVRGDNGWCPVSETAHIFSPFWRKRREVVLENPNLLTD